MKRPDFKKHSPVFYIGKGLIVVSVVITASLGFLLGYFVGKNVNSTPVVHSNSVAIPINEERQTPEIQEKAATDQKAGASQENRDNQLASLQRTAQNTGSTPLEQQQETAQSLSKPETKQAQAAKPIQESLKKKDSRETDNKQQPQKTLPPRKYTVQVGAFKSADEAEALKVKLSKKGYRVSVMPMKTSSNQILHKVTVGEYATRKDAEVLSIKLKNSEGLRTFVTFVIQEVSPRHP